LNLEVGKQEQQFKAMVKEVGESIKPIGGNMKQISKSGETNRWEQ